MTTLTLADALRHSIGFDPLARFAEASASRATNYPPYNVERISDHGYRVTLAVAGFAREEISIMVKDRMLTVIGTKTPEKEERSYLHRGIALRDFSRQFALGEHVEVFGASLDNGLLVLDLERQLPEAAKPKVIAIR